jgi:hypothetical protein
MRRSFVVKKEEGRMGLNGRKSCGVLRRGSEY